ncbi:50S ribosomal protein L20 [candidate division WOR-3 bacterium]|nr:50S ribosomal protein L20 [candidate division WOR-3 bacterium]
MPRSRSGASTHARKTKWRRYARGYWGGRHRLTRTIRYAVQKGWESSYRDRRRKKREMRALWNIRINAALRPQGLNYSRFIYGLKQQRIDVSRKVLAQLAVENPEDFAALANKVKEGLDAGGTTSS